MVSSHKYEYWWECKLCNDSDWWFYINDREEDINTHKRSCCVFAKRKSRGTTMGDLNFNRWKVDREKEKEKKKATETKAPVINFSGNIYVNSVVNSNGVINIPPNSDLAKQIANFAFQA
jgi:hypothetical protein